MSEKVANPIFYGSLVPARRQREAARAAAAIFGTGRRPDAAAGPPALRGPAHPAWTAGGLVMWNLHPAARTHLWPAKRNRVSRSCILVELGAVLFDPLKAEHEKKKIICSRASWDSRQIIQSKHSLTFCRSGWWAWQQSPPPCRTCTGNGSCSQSSPSRRHCQPSSASLGNPAVCSGSSCLRRRSAGKWPSFWMAAKTCRSPSRSCADLRSGWLDGETPACLAPPGSFRDEMMTSAKRQTHGSFKPGLRQPSRPATCSEA